MSISSINSGYQAIQKSNSLLEEAANDIATTSNSPSQNLQKTDIAPSEQPEKPSSQESILKLQQASTYHQAGANVVQRSNDIIGTILDTHV